MSNRQMNMHKRQKLDTRTLGRLLKYLGGKRLFILAVVMVCILIGALVNVRGTTFIGSLIDNEIKPLLTQSGPVKDFSSLANAIRTMAIIYVIGVAVQYARALLTAYLTQDVMRNVRDDMFVHMQSLPIRYFDTNTFGDIMSHYTNDTDTLRMLFSQSIPQFLDSAMTLVTTLIAMIRLNIPLTGLVLLFVALMLVLVGRIGGASGKYFIAQQRSLGTMNGFIEEMINGQKVIKVFTHEEQAKTDFDRLNEELCNNATKANTFAGMMMPITANLGNIQYIVTAVVGSAIALRGGSVLTLGMLISFLNLSRNFNRPISMVASQLNAVVMAIAGAQRIFELLDEEPEQDEGYVTLVNAEYYGPELREAPSRTGIWAWKHPHHDGTVTYTKLKGDILFDGVDFSYDGEKQVLFDISMYAHPGQKVAFVGATGAGKTTITNLINRFYDIADGKIRYDGININKIKKPDLRRSLGIVLQETNLFTGTVMDNIRYGRLDATDAQCRLAANLVNADGFITRLPHGYDTLLEDNGSNLSQGQRQLIAIARAAVADPPVMILDEATSSIDTRTEALVQRGMDRLMKGRTVFVIAHRLSTVQNSNVIMVMDHGRIIERGTHDQLLEQKGSYYQLYTGKLELE